MKIRNFIKEERIILIICFLVFVVSAAYAFYFRIEPAVDARTYDQIATNLIAGNGYRIDKNLPFDKDEAIAYQGPLYAYFLAAIYFVFGHHWEAAWLIQALLRALSALLIFLICKKLFGEGEYRRIGHIAAILFGFYPDLIEIGAMLLTETFFIFLSLTTVYLFARYYEKFSPTALILLGLFFGLAILTRSTIGLFLLPFLFYFLKRKQIGYAILLIFLVALVLTPWAIRNYRVYHEFLPTMANGGYSLHAGNYVGASGEGGVPPNHQEIISRYGVIGANNYNMAQFKNFVRQHPFTYLKLTFERIIKYFSFIRPMGFWFYQRGLGQFIFIMTSALASVILFTFGFAGIFAALKKERQNAPLIYLIVFAFLICIAVVPVVIETRYRLPIYSLMAIFAGFFIGRMLVFKREYLRYLIAAFLILSFFSIINAILEYDKIIEKFGQFFN